MITVAIRDAVAADEAAIAQLHVESWRQSYRGLLPDSHLDAELPQVMAARWAGIFERRGVRDLLLAADADGRLAGFLYAFPDPGSGDRLEIDNLHVAAAQRSRGLGAQLMRAAATRALAQGMRGGILYVVEGNLGAARLYARLGGRPLPVVPHEIPGLGPVSNVPFVWDDLAPLAACGVSA